LVHHYFGTKEKLFAAVVHIPMDPMEIIRPLRLVPVEELGRTIPSILLPLWDSEVGAGFIAALRSILTGSEVNLFRSFIQDVIGVEVGARVDDPPGTGIIRIQFVASQLVGVLMARYILDLEPFRSLPVEQVAATIAPNLQRYLTGDLPDLFVP
jgi:AcrR family transcriptional regulator